MIILSGATNNLPGLSARLIALFGSGASAGQRPSRWRMHLGRGCPGVSPPEVRVQMTPAACQLPRQHDVLLARWSRAELARRIAAAYSHCSVSPSTVERWVHVKRLRPWNYRIW